MARESQGLQIALIIFVMLTVVLAVTTFLYHSRYTEALKAAKDSEERANQEHSKAATKETECGDLKRVIGMADKTAADIQEQYAKDMKSFGANFPEDARFYSPLLARLWEAADDKSNDVKKLGAKLQELEGKFAVREAAKDDEMVQIRGAFKKLKEEYDAAVNGFKKDDANRLAAETEALANLLKSQKTATAKIGDVEAKANEERKINTNLVQINKQLGERIDKLTPRSMDRPCGKVDYVNQRAHTVWINRGRADGLPMQITFGVFSGDAADLGKAVKKGSIEVTRILGDNSAEARIIEDKDNDPIVPGDLIFTQLWSPGEKLHFALAGSMDLEGDGQNAVSAVCNLINMNGGMVDCWMDEKGKRIGDPSPHTNYLVIGDEPKGQGDAVRVFGDIVTAAERAGARKIKLVDLKQMMGYKKQVSVERFTPAVGGPRPGAPAAKPAAKPRRATPKEKEPAEEAATE
jgi:hypothetical protein